MKVFILSGLSILYTACGGSGNTNFLEDMDIVPMCHVGSSNTYLYFNINGQQAFEGEFTRADLFSCGLAKVGKHENDTYRTVFIDKQGKTVFDVSNYREVTGFWDDMAWAKKEDNSVVALNTKGKEVFVLAGTPMSMFNDGKALVEMESGKYGIVNTKGDISPIETEFEVKKVPVIYADRLLIYDNARGDGVIDLKGNIIVEPGFYWDVQSFDVNGCAVVGHSRNWFSLIDKNGKELIDSTLKYNILQCDGDWYKFVQCAGNQCTTGWCDKHGNAKMILDNEQIEEERGRTSMIGFFGSDYAFWGKNRIDRKGQIVKLQEAVKTPLLGGKSVVAKSPINGYHVTLFSKDGQCLNNGEFYMAESLKYLIYEEYAKGFPYIDTYWVLGD